MLNLNKKKHSVKRIMKILKDKILVFCIIFLFSIAELVYIFHNYQELPIFDLIVVIISGYYFTKFGLKAIRDYQKINNNV